MRLFALLFTLAVFIVGQVVTAVKVEKHDYAGAVAWAFTTLLALGLFLTA